VAERAAWCDILSIMGLYLFCDNSNLFIEAQWAAGRADGLRGPS